MDLEKGSRLDPRRWNWKRANPFGRNWNPLEWSWTTRNVASRMMGIACAGTIAYAIGWLQAWMPNVVVGSLTVAITVTVVERALRDAERATQRARDHPIMNVIRTRLDLEMMGFVYALLSDYSTTHLNTDTPIPNTVADLCDMWLDGSEDTARPDRPVGAYPYLLHEARTLSDHLSRVRGQYAFVVERSPLLVDAIERFSEWVALGSSFVEREKAAADARVSPQQEHVLLTRVVEATKSLAAALKSEADYEPRITEEQRGAVEEWNCQGRQLAAQREGKALPDSQSRRGDLGKDGH
jgi:hypothetical protein